MKKRVKSVVLAISLLLTSVSFSQTNDNIKISLKKCDGIYAYFVNTKDFNVANNLDSGMIIYYHVDDVTTVIKKYNVGDTALIKKLGLLPDNDTIAFFFSLPYPKVGVLVKSVSENLLLKVGQKLDSYKPCYATVDPVTEKPTIFFEGLEGYNLSHFDIKLNDKKIATVPYAKGVLSYVDQTNTQVLNFVQDYTVVAVDSCGNEQSGKVSTIHARNLSSVDGKVEMDWTVPTTAKPITNYFIYEFKKVNNVDTLILITQVPSTVTQYTVTNPNPNSAYIVGLEEMNCEGTGKLKSISSKLVLSNKVKSGQKAGLSNNVEYTFSIYPNPSKGLVQFSGNENIVGKVVSISDVAGKVVYTTSLTSSNHQLDLSHLTKGTYIVKVGEWANTKFVIE